MAGYASRGSQVNLSDVISIPAPGKNICDTGVVISCNMDVNQYIVLSSVIPLVRVLISAGTVSCGLLPKRFYGSKLLPDSLLASSDDMLYPDGDESESVALCIEVPARLRSISDMRALASGLDLVCVSSSLYSST